MTWNKWSGQGLSFDGGQDQFLHRRSQKTMQPEEKERPLAASKSKPQAATAGKIKRAEEQGEAGLSREDRQRWQRLKKCLKAYEDPSLGLVVYDPTTHQQAGLQANKVFYAASLAKLPIILWTLQQVRQGQVTWESTFPYTDKANAIAGAMVTGGTGSLQFEAYPGKTYSVRDLMDRTIRESDNQAANLLSYYLGESQADAYYRFRRQFDQKAEKFFHKSMTAQVAMRYMLALSKEKELADPFQHSLWSKDKIGCLPYPVWHKIGVNGQYNHDAAYVQADRPYILVVMTEGWSDERIAQLAQAIDHVLQEKD